MATFDPSKVLVPSATSATGVQRSTAGAYAFNDAIFTPLEIANCELWLDATAGPVKADWTPCIADNDAVTTWLDNSGNSRHATVVSGTPAYKPTGGCNGKPGVTGRMQTPGFVPVGWASTFTIFIVSKDTSAAGLRIKVSIGAGIYFGYNTTSGQRDLSLTGASPSGSSIGMPKSGGIDCLAFGASEQTIYTGGFGITSSSSNAVMHRASTGGLTFADTAVTVGGYASSGTYDWTEGVSEVLIYSRYLSDDEKRRVFAYLSAKWETVPLVVLAGNSLMAGFGSTLGTTQIPLASGDNIPSKVIAALGGSARVFADCYPGRTTEQIYAESQRFSALVSAPAPRTVTVIWEGTNSMSTSNSPRAAYDWLRRTCIAKRSASQKVVVGTVLPRGDTASDTRNAANTETVNALIRANWPTFADGLVDIAADSRFADYTNATYFNGDQTHLTDAGYAAAAGLIAAAVQPMLA